MRGLKSEIYEFILIFVIVLCVSLFLFSNFSIHGSATAGSTISNVSLSKYFAISFGSNLSSGIEFGTVSFLPAENVNASHNYDGDLYGTTYTLEVHNDSNTAVDFCIRANSGLTSPSFDVIEIGNETYSVYNLTNSTHPEVSNETSLTTGYVKAISDIPVGEASYWRFWLDVPSSQPTGSYNNTLFFQGIIGGGSC